MEKNTKAFISIPLTIGILLGTAVAGVGIYKGVDYFQSESIAQKAEKLKNSEKHQSAIKSLKQLKKATTFQTFKEEAQQKIEKNQQLIQDKANYYKGVEKANNDQWGKAMEVWEKIPQDSIYFKKIKNSKDLAYEKPSGEAVQLVNYKHADNPNWKELKSFLKADNTDEHPYKEDDFVCTNFAEMLHNRAEKHGIKSAVAGIDFKANTDGHLIDAFKTKNKGLIYVDNTGRNFNKMRRDEMFESKCERDKIAYVVEGEKYGAISIGYLSTPQVSSNEDPRFNYQFYKEYSKKWKELKKEIVNFNKGVENYTQKQEKYEQKSKDYKAKTEKYKNLKKKYQNKLSKLKKEVENEYKSELESINSSLEEWEEKKKEYEAELQEYEQKVKKYEEEGIGNFDELREKEEELEKRRKKLNQKHKNLIQEKNKIKGKIQEQIKKRKEEELSSLKEKIEEKEAELKEMKNNLEKQKKELDKMFNKIKGNKSKIHKKEQELGTCYWNPLPEVKDIELRW